MVATKAVSRANRAPTTAAYLLIRLSNDLGPHGLLGALFGGVIF
jgi:hypothetical protein